MTRIETRCGVDRGRVACMVAELTAADDLCREIRERCRAAQFGHRSNQRPIRSQDRASERVADHLSRHRRHDLRFARPQVLQQTVAADDGRLVGEFTGDVDGLAVGVRGAAAADRVEAFEGETERVDAQVAIGAGGVALVLRQPFAQRLAGECLVVCRDGAGVSRGLRRRSTRESVAAPSPRASPGSF